MTSSTRVSRESAQTIDRTPWGSLLILALATFVTVTSEMAPAALLPQISRGLAVPESRAGLLVSAWALTIAVSSLPLVRLTAHLSRRRLLGATLVVLTAANLATALAPSYALALASRVVAASAHGVFWSVVVVYAGSIVAERHVGRALSVVLAGPTLAGIVGVPLAATLGVHVDWRLVFVGLAGLTGATAVALAVLLPRTAPSRGGTDGEAAPAGVPVSTRWDVSSPAVLSVAVVGSLILVAHFAVFTYVSPLLTDVGGFSPAGVGPALFAFGVAGALGLAVAAFLSDRLPRAALVVTAWLFALALGSLTLLGHSTATSVAAVVLWGALIGLLPPVLQARVLRLSSAAFRDTAGAVLVTTLNVGIAAGALLGGLVVAGPGAAALAAVAAVAVAGAATVLTVLTLRAARGGR